MDILVQNDPLAPVNVLVVDDVPENCTALQSVLSTLDCRVVIAGSGAEALRRLLVDEFAVLLIDVVMPGMNGFDLVAAIKERERTASVPIVFLTAEASDLALIYRGYGVGAVDYLVKPLVPEMVRAKVEVFTALFRQRKRIEQQAARLLEAERNESELRLVELRLANDRRYRRLTEAVPQIIWTARADGALDYFNRRWFEYTGVSVEGADSWLGFLFPEDKERCQRDWEKALSSTAMFQIECRLRRADGAYRWHLCRAVPEQNASGQTISWLGTFTDIEDQKRVQEVLLEFKGTLDAVFDAVLIFELNGFRPLYANQGAHLLLGYTEDELLQIHPVDFMVEYDHARFREILAPIRDGSTERVAVETPCRRKDGREVPTEFSFQLVRIDGGHVVAIGRDITDRKLAELEREQLYGEAVAAVRARDEFLSVASHELRTPLSSLQLQLQLLAEPPDVDTQREPPSSRIKGGLDVAARQVSRLSSLISELMDVTRISAGQLHLEIERTDLADVARDVVGRFRGDATKANCQVHLKADRPVIGQWDRLRMEQVVTNLLTNAFKFGAGKPVEITVTFAEPLARLVVSDHGVGIEPADAERIFQRFERTSSAERHAGLGLGLYITRQIVEAHGGEIRVESQPGRGSSFTVELPLEAQTAQDEQETQVA